MRCRNQVSPIIRILTGICRFSENFSLSSSRPAPFALPFRYMQLPTVQYPYGGAGRNRTAVQHTFISIVSVPKYHTIMFHTTCAVLGSTISFAHLEDQECGNEKQRSSKLTMNIQTKDGRDAQNRIDQGHQFVQPFRQVPKPNLVNPRSLLRTVDRQADCEPEALRY